jgi:phage FluMu protein Com
MLTTCPALRRAKSKTKETNMKNIRLLVAAALAATVITAQADSPNWPRAPYKAITTVKQAEDCCAAGGKVALACPDCKTLNEKGEKKEAAAFFDKSAKHDCAGCKGVITVKNIAGGKVQDAQQAHECSKCKTGAFTCATHTKGAK